MQNGRCVSCFFQIVYYLRQKYKNGKFQNLVFNINTHRKRESFRKKKHLRSKLLAESNHNKNVRSKKKKINAKRLKLNKLAIRSVDDLLANERQQCFESNA